MAQGDGDDEPDGRTPSHGPLRRWVTRHWRSIVAVTSVLAGTLGIVANVLGIGSALGFVPSAPSASATRKATQATSAPGLPRYTREIANFEPAEKVTRFLENHLDQRVYIDALLASNVRPIADDGGYSTFGGNSNPSITIWSRCFQTVAPNEEPNEESCLGTQIMIAAGPTSSTGRRRWISWSPVLPCADSGARAQGLSTSSFRGHFSQGHHRAVVAEGDRTPTAGPWRWSGR